jgi:hemerythrin superfamily protein
MKGRAMTDVVALIKSQHRQVEALLEKAQNQDGDVASLMQQVSDLLVPHSEAEESFVYPTIRNLDPSETEEVHDGAAEHHHIEELLRELLSQEPDSPGFDGKLAALVGELQHHVEEEEEDLLPILSKKASDEQRADLGARFALATGVSETEAAASELSRDELYEKAKEQDVPGRSTMSKDELAKAVDPSA